MRHDFFISYAAEDRVFADQLVAALEATSMRCFIDHRDISASSQDYRRDLAEGIKNSETILVIVSACGQASEEVAREIQFANDHGRRKIAVWIENFPHYTSDAMQLLLTSVQQIDGSDRDIQVIVKKVAATTTLASIQGDLESYDSVTDRLRIDLKTIFLQIENHDRPGAMADVEATTVSVIRRVYGHGPSDSRNLQELVHFYRDQFESETLIRGFSNIAQLTAMATLKQPSVDSLTRALESLMQVLANLEGARWGIRDLNPQLSETASFISGLLNEAGWLRGEELVPSEDLVYLLFEKPVGVTKKYLEIVVSKDADTASAMSEVSSGRIFPTDGIPTTTRFVVVDSGENSVGVESSPDGKLFSLDEFIARLLGLSKASRSFENHANSLRARLDESIAVGARNIFLYGNPGSGKTTALRSLHASGWEAQPAFRFYVDFKDAVPGAEMSHLDVALREAFAPQVGDRSRSIATYLVRSGRAALLVDSIEIPANPANPQSAALALAKLCLFLSLKSTVVLSGRSAALRDSASVRAFVNGQPAPDELLAGALNSHGVDGASLPQFAMIRSNELRRAESIAALTAEDRLIDVLAESCQGKDEQARANQLSREVGDLLGRQGASPQRLPRQLLEAWARGLSTGDGEHAHVSLASVAVSPHSPRLILEFRAALDYAHSALGLIDPTPWEGLQVSEATRRFVRLVSLASGESDREHFELSLVGPGGATFAVRHGGPVPLAPRPVLLGELKDFLQSAIFVAHEELGHADGDTLHPMYTRLPARYFTTAEFDDLPATGVSLRTAKLYAEWRKARLPTSLEWQISGRRWDGRIFPWGDDVLHERIRCAQEVGDEQVIDYTRWRQAMRDGRIAVANSRHPDSASGNRAVGGQLDMVGNVWEWTSTTVGERAVVAGGSYDNPLSACTLESLCIAPQTTRSNAVGFRIVEPAT